MPEQCKAMKYYGEPIKSLVSLKYNLMKSDPIAIKGDSIGD